MLSRQTQLREILEAAIEANLMRPEADQFIELLDALDDDPELEADGSDEPSLGAPESDEISNWSTMTFGNLDLELGPGKRLR